MATLSKLPNGISVACDERPGTGLVSMQVSIKSGSLNETPDEEGLTHLTMKSVLAGSKTRSRAEAANAIESKGGVYGAGSDRSRAMFTVNCLAAHAGQSF